MNKNNHEDFDALTAAALAKAWEYERDPTCERYDAAFQALQAVFDRLNVIRRRAAIENLALFDEARPTFWTKCFWDDVQPPKTREGLEALVYLLQSVGDLISKDVKANDPDGEKRHDA